MESDTLTAGRSETSLGAHDILLVSHYTAHFMGMSVTGIKVKITGF